MKKIVSSPPSRTLCLRSDLLAIALLLFAICSLHAAPAAPEWPQFRGPDGLGIADKAAKPPLHFGPQSNVLWSVELPTGHSSPVIVGNHIFLTSLADKKLTTLCLDRASGKVLWQREAPAEKLEPTHRIASPASSTCCTDGERVYSYFGSFGLLCYDLDGTEKWYRQLPAPVVEFGTGASPILAGDRLILNCDQDHDSYLLAVDKRTGKDVWRTDRSEFRRGFSTPFVWRHDGMEELVVTGSLWLKSYDLATGKELWNILGMARVANASPIAGDGLLFASSWNVGGDVGERIAMPPFKEYAAKYDKNHDGKLTLEEMPKDVFRDRFGQIDVNKDKLVTEQEWDDMATMFDKAENSIFAVRPGGKGDITKTHVVWKNLRSLPYVSSPLFYEGRIYTMKSGGLASCYEAKTGKVLYQDERIGAPGDYYASAVAADGRVYFVNQRGTVVVLQAGDALKVLTLNDLGEDVMATPAIIGNTLYVRTVKHLFAFAAKY